MLLLFEDLFSIFVILDGVSSAVPLIGTGFVEEWLPWLVFVAVVIIWKLRTYIVHDRFVVVQLRKKNRQIHR